MTNKQCIDVVSTGLKPVEEYYRRAFGNGYLGLVVVTGKLKGQISKINVRDGEIVFDKMCCVIDAKTSRAIEPDLKKLCGFLYASVTEKFGEEISIQLLNKAMTEFGGKQSKEMSEKFLTLVPDSLLKKKQIVMS